jgi:hypothetical protein
MGSLWCRGRLWILVAILFPLFTFGQITFNKAYQFGDLTLCQSVQEIEGGYLLSAFSFYMPEGALKLDLGRCDEFGEIVSLMTYGSFSEQYRLYSYSGLVANGKLLNDSTWVTTWVKLVNGTEKTCIVWSDLNGDTLFTRTFSSPHESQVNYFRPTHMDIGNDGNVYVSTRVRQSDLNSDIYVLKLSSNGDVIWIYNPQTPENELARSLRVDGDGVIIHDINNNPNQWTLRKRFSPTEVDWVTNVNNTTDYSTPREFIVEEDGVVFCAVYPVNSHVLPAAVKINFSGGLVWFFGATGEFNWFSNNQCGQIEKTQDGGYLLGAEEMIYNPPNPEINGSFNDYVRLIKLDANGNHQWDRYYHYIVSINETHQLADLRATSDGGYVFCGHMVDMDLENNGNNGSVIQWGWVVKVDACGCLVPGCDPDCIYPGVEEATTEEKEKPTYFVCGPNPAGDFLNIYMREVPEGATMFIHDMAGKELSRFAAGRAGVTHMASLRGWSAGVYVVSLEMGGEVLQSLKVVKE